MEKLDTCRKSTAVRTCPPKATDHTGSKSSTEQLGPKSKGHTVVKEGTNEYEILNVTSPGKVTPWNVSVDIEGVTVLDTGG